MSFTTAVRKEMSAKVVGCWKCCAIHSLTFSVCRGAVGYLGRGSRGKCHRLDKAPTHKQVTTAAALPFSLFRGPVNKCGDRKVAEAHSKYVIFLLIEIKLK